MLWDTITDTRITRAHSQTTLTQGHNPEKRKNSSKHQHHHLLTTRATRSPIRPRRLGTQDWPILPFILAMELGSPGPSASPPSLVPGPPRPATSNASVGSAGEWIHGHSAASQARAPTGFLLLTALMLAPWAS